MGALRLLPRRLHVFTIALVVYLCIKGTQKSLRFIRWVRRSVARKKAPSDRNSTDTYDEPGVDRSWEEQEDERENRQWSRTHSFCAKRLQKFAIKRGALWLKFCQYLASRADVLPNEYVTVLETCLDDAPPETPEVTLKTLCEELKCNTPEELFEGFDPASPIASASIAQVHRATLRSDGRDVVLKIQRPGVKQVLLQDLEDLTTILVLVAGAEPKFDFRPMLDAWMDMVPLETDFIHEMKNSELVRSKLDAARGTDLESKAFVPVAVPEYTTQRVLCTEFVSGCGVKDLDAMDAAGVDREEFIREVSKAFALQVHVIGKVNADIHPGNCLVQFNRDGTPGGVPALIDFGITVELTDKQRLGFCRTIMATVDNSSYSLLQSFDEMDIVMNRADPAMSMHMIKHLFRSTVSKEDTVRQSREFLRRQKQFEENAKDSGIAVGKDIQARVQERSGASASAGYGSTASPTSQASSKKTKEKSEAAKLPLPVDALPGYLVFMFRTIALLRGLSSRLGVEHAYLPILKRYAERALYDACPAPERMVAPVFQDPDLAQLPRGMTSRRAQRARNVLAKIADLLVKKGFIVGCQVAAYQGGECVLDMAVGRRGKYNPRPVTPSTLFNCFSTGKGVIALLFATLAHEHGIQYKDLVSKHWPEYACHGKEKTRIEHILSHSAGLATAAPPDMRMVRLRDDWQGVIDWLAKEARPAHAPGDHSEYHFLTFGWLVAGILQSATKQSIQTLLRTFAQKLGVEDECFLGLPWELCADDPKTRVASLSNELFTDVSKMLQAVKARRKSEASGQGDSPANAEKETRDAENMERMYNEEGGHEDGAKFVFASLMAGNQASSMQNRENGVRPQDSPELQRQMDKTFEQTPYLMDTEYFNHPVMRSAVIPSANCHFTARALAKMYGAFANEGQIDGTEIVARDHVVEMMQTLIEPPAPATTEDGRQELSTNPEAWGAGVRLYDCVNKGGKTLPKAAMGHGGVGGSMALCIPSAKFSIAFTCNQLNAYSVAETVLIGAACVLFDVPVPHTYAKMMRSVREEGLGSADDVIAFVDQKVAASLENIDILRAMTG